MRTGDPTPGPPWVTAAVGDTRMHRLVGRERELAVLYGMIDPLSRDAGGALVLRGDAGIGKSSLLAAATDRAKERGWGVLSAAGVQSEAHLPFAGLHQLLAPVLHRAAGLPLRRRAALRAAFGLSDDTAPELFLVALATLEVIGDTAHGVPVLLIIEDAQWLDQPSAAALAVVARRLESEPAAMLIAIRDGYESPFDAARLPEVRLEGLDETAAVALLAAHAAGLGPELRQRLLDEAAGNPLALVELPKALRLVHCGDGVLLPSRLPLTARLERAFADQAAELPARTRTLLLTGAADDRGILAELLRAATIVERAAVTIEAVAPAVAARLVQVEGSGLRFRHPLVRSALYQAASLAQRQAVHAALADVLSDQPDRRVWHRAAATLGPDDQVAAELDAAAARATRRGALAVAIVAQERAAEVSASAERRGSRLVLAAEMAFEAGRPAVGLRLVRAAEPLDLTTEARTRLAWLRAMYDDARWSDGTRIGIGSLVATAEQMRMGGHADLAVKALLTVAARCWWGNPDADTRTAVVAAAERLPLAPDDPALLAILAHADPVQRGALVIDRIARLTPDPADPAAMHLIGSAASAVWAYDLALGFLAPAVSGLRAQGRLSLLVQALVAQAWAAVHQGREPLAVAAAEEAAQLARETGERRWTAAALLAQATIAAERGDFAQAEARAGEAEAMLVTMGTTPMLALAQFVRGRGAVAHQHYEEGFAHHRRTLDPRDPAYHPFVGAWGLSDLVEAAAHSGKKGAALAYLTQLEALAAATSGSLLRAEAGYARPLVADDDHAEALYQAAIGRDLVNWPCYRGRMLLWYGRWLRRQRRVADSRAPLRTAREGFDALAFPRLAESARQELRASGETSRRRIPAAWDQLTPQELQIARLAAAGFSNREIGEQLYITHRTVGYHLHKVFNKLGLTSRGHLHAVELGLTASDVRSPTRTQAMASAPAPGP